MSDKPEMLEEAKKLLSKSMDVLNQIEGGGRPDHLINEIDDWIIDCRSMLSERERGGQ